MTTTHDASVQTEIQQDASNIKGASVHKNLKRESWLAVGGSTNDKRTSFEEGSAIIYYYYCDSTGMRFVMSEASSCLSTLKQLKISLC